MISAMQRAAAHHGDRANAEAGITSYSKEKRCGDSGACEAAQSSWQIQEARSAQVSHGLRRRCNGSGGGARATACRVSRLVAER